MGVNLYRLEYQNVYDHLTEEEIRFIELFPLGDTASYYVDRDNLKYAVSRAKKDGNEVPRELVKRLREELQKNDGYDVQIC
jgi:hypothetical protein